MPVMSVIFKSTRNDGQEREGQKYPRQECKMHKRKRNSSRIQRPSSRVRVRSPIARYATRNTPNSRSGYKHNSGRKAFLPNVSDYSRRHAMVG